MKKNVFFAPLFLYNLALITHDATIRAWTRLFLSRFSLFVFFFFMIQKSSLWQKYILTVQGIFQITPDRIKLSGNRNIPVHFSSPGYSLFAVPFTFFFLPMATWNHESKVCELEQFMLTLESFCKRHPQKERYRKTLVVDIIECRPIISLYICFLKVAAHAP